MSSCSAGRQPPSGAFAVGTRCVRALDRLAVTGWRRAGAAVSCRGPTPSVGRGGRCSVSESVGLQIQVLGPLQVSVDGRVAPLRGVRQRRLMAALVAVPNRVVASDRLADVVWGDAPPEAVGAALAKDVYKLRTALGSVGAAGLVVTQAPGYRLEVDEDRIDTGRFAALVAQGQQILEADPARALSVMNEALALWRGLAWAEFADEDFARPLVAGLDELRALAIESRADAMLALGRHEEVVPELQYAVASYPLRERPRAQLMRALYLAGRHSRH
jgi:DNA-binding SARP family transcriptional activator